jgi:hypothetical protein
MGSKHSKSSQAEQAFRVSRLAITKPKKSEIFSFLSIKNKT